jgi:hypothetical protein
LARILALSALIAAAIMSTSVCDSSGYGVGV